jgi:hypothetical protein
MTEPTTSAAHSGTVLADVLCEINYCGLPATHDRDNVFDGGPRVAMCAACATEAAEYGHTGIRRLTQNNKVSGPGSAAKGQHGQD